MKIMRVTVAKRLREIGIRKALGAHHGDILLQFLTKSALLAHLEGLVGTRLATLATHVVGQAIGIPAALTLPSVTLALEFYIVVGMVFGVLRAFRAARPMPQDALCSE